MIRAILGHLRRPIQAAGAGRWLVPILISLLLLCCGGTPEARLQRVRELRRSSKLQQALSETERELARLPKDSLDYWRFLMQKIQMVERRSPEVAAQLFAEKPPNDKRFATIRARFKIEEAYLNMDFSRYAVAEQLAKEAEEIAAAEKSLREVVPAQLLRAQVFSKTGRYAEAEQLARAANEKVAALHDSEVEAYALDTLAQNLAAQYRFEEALPYFEKETTLRQKLGDPARLATCFINLGRCRAQLGELDGALDLYQKAEKLGAQSSDDTGLVNAIGNTGTVYLDRGDIKTALKYFEQALGLAEHLKLPKDIARWNSNLATALIEGKDWKSAGRYNSEAIALRRQLGEPIAYSQVNAARILDGEDNTAAAEKLYLEVASAKSNDMAPALYAHSGLARMYVRLAQDAKADREYQAALHTVEQSTSTLRKDENKLTLLSSQIEVQGEYIDFLMARGRTEAALEVAEASRARLLQERYGDGQATHTVSASLYKRVAQECHAVLLSYWLGPKRSYVWLTTPQQIVAYTLPSQERLRRLVENYRQLIESVSDPLEEDDATGAELYEGLLGPIADRLPKDATVIIAPDGALNALNFETLPVPGGRPHYLIEDARIAVVPSLNLLVQSESAGRGHRNGRVLLIGDPDSDDEQFPKLSYAEAEIRDVDRHFEPSLVSTFTKGSAVPEAYRHVESGNYSYVHFTAHASTNREIPMESAIILSGKPGANRLTAAAVRDRKIDAEVVTISACRSAGAKTYAGEGLVGFMWAFFKAGAHNIVAGLWDVSDESTPQLMDEMYAGLTRGETAVMALRNAKLKVMQSNKTFKLPYYWGPFQLYMREIPAVRVSSVREVARSTHNPAGGGSGGQSVLDHSNPIHEDMPDPN